MPQDQQELLRLSVVRQSIFRERMMGVVAALCIAGGAFFPHVVTGADVAAVNARLADEIDTLLANYRGQVSVFVRHLPSHAEFVSRGDEVMPTASLIKLPILLTAYLQASQGQFDLSKKLTFREEDRTPGSGILTTQFSPGTELSLRDALRLMIRYSDNSATNMVLKELELTRVNEALAAWNCPQTRLHALVYRPESSISPADSQKWGLGKTTAREMATLLIRLHAGELLPPESQRFAMGHLFACEDQSRLGALLPEGTRIAMKTGAVTAARTVAGIIESPSGPLVVCILTADNRDRRWTHDNAAYRLFAEIARSAWDATNLGVPEPLPLPTDGLLAVGARGPLVEDLQRVLNLQLEADKRVTIDGEFGPQTELALKSFQKKSRLPETGTTDSATWAALGPLPLPVSTEGDLDGPTLPPLSPPDVLDGPPIVSCRSWAVGNPGTGEILGGQDMETPRDFASTTKIMTCYTILKLAEQTPTVLDERVTFSITADQTPGSTAGLRAGESCTVRELLYGLMLPSGNDASIALAEHFGPRCTTAPASAPLNPLSLFVARMNELANELKLTKTHYSNPHGLTDPEHQSSAADQFRLTVAVLKFPLFRELVSARRYQCRVQGPGGYQREVVWTNTNRLLNQEGFAGVKTGTTTAAGACLITLARRADQEAVAVVLGATSVDSRYIDSRNLLRWYWTSTQTP